jgi:hypothetical protein
MAGDISGQDIFNVINATRLELNNNLTSAEKGLTLAVENLGNKLDKLQEGRLADVEKMAYDTHIRFQPVERIVYGLVALVLVAVFGAILTLVVK